MGAGSTTLIRTLLGLTTADAGTMSLLGIPVPAERSRALARVGAIVDEPRFHPHLTGRDNFRLLAGSRVRAPGSAAQRGLLLHVRQLLGIAHGVEPGDEAVVDAHRDDGVDLAVEPDDQRRVPVDLGRLQRGRGGDPA